MIYFLQFWASIVLDLLFGDPRWYPHPVRLIGWLISRCEQLSRRICGERRLKLAGFCTVLVVCGVTTGLVFALLWLVGSFSTVAADLLAIVLLYTTVAIKDLLAHALTVYRLLVSTAPIEQAREAVGMIVGRETARLDEAGVTRACIETVAENMADGVTAPLFYAIIASILAPLVGLSPIGCSALGAFCYKSINTMDSMIGYKNEKYRDYGMVAAKLDDLVNLVPARLSGLCMIMAAFFLKFDYRGAAKVFFRDRLRHSSPNAGHTEAAAAGALGVRLGGPSYYHGSLVEKPWLGDALRDVEAEDIRRTNRLMLVASLVFLLTMFAVRQMVLA